MISSLEADVPRWRRLNALLQEALELSKDQREAWLGLLPPEAKDLLPLLRALLARDAAAETDDFMRRSAEAVWAQAIAGTGSAMPGALVGPYRLIREIGTGGMGTVWLAERADGALQRQVALKLPLYGWALGVAERLEQERDALASLEHPHIARLYDAGITPEGGRPYLAMEFIDGLPIDAYARGRNLTVRARVQLLLQVSSAVAYAHGRLIVHRDLKPSNILVTADGSAHLLDFGAAKLLSAEGGQHSQLTREAGRALSPDYASPEQIHGAAITVASDVYSLGVVLFELLTGARPYALSRHSTAALEAAIMRTEVPLPSATVSDNRRLSRELRGDLDNILAKALKKSPDERYATVTEFSDDLQRWLRDEPVSARPDSVIYRLVKFVQRNRFLVLVGTLVFVALASAAVVTSINMIEARTQRDEARLQANRAQAQERFANLVMEQTGPGGRPLTREEMIDRSVELLEQQYGNDPRFVANTLVSISGRYMDLGNTSKELASLQKAEAIARQLRDSLLLINVQCSAVDTEVSGGRLDRARERLVEARSLLGALMTVPINQRIDCMHAEATLADAQGDAATAIEQIQKAIALQEQLDRTDLTYRSLLSHAQSFYLHAARPRDAYTMIEKTVASLKATDAQNSEALSGSMHNAAVALSQMGEVGEALEKEREVLELTAGDDPSKPVNPIVANVLGRLLTRMNQAAEGASWAKRSLADARTDGNVSAQVFAHAALAEALASEGLAEQAGAAAQAAAALIEVSSERRLRTVVDRARTLATLAVNDLPGAQAAAASLLKDVGYPDLTKVHGAQSGDLQLLLAARVALRAGRAHEAGQLSTAALDLAAHVARDPQRSATVGEARLLLARACVAQGDRLGARAAIHGAHDALSSGLAPDHPLAREAATLEAQL
jgi:eukaryotic-like serine/threonine-protein kinase